MRKENGKKPSYSLGSNLGFAWRHMWECGKKDTLAVFLRAPLLVLVSYLGVWMSQAVVRGVTQGDPPHRILLTVGFFTLLTGLAVAAEFTAASGTPRPSITGRRKACRSAVGIILWKMRGTQ